MIKVGFNVYVIALFAKSVTLTGLFLCSGSIIALSEETEDREYRPLEMIKDNYPKYVMTTDYLLQKRNGIRHVNILSFMQTGQEF